MQCVMEMLLVYNKLDNFLFLLKDMLKFGYSIDLEIYLRIRAT